LSKKLGVTLQSGINMYSGEIVYWNDSKDDEFSLLPVLLGGRYYFNKMFFHLKQ
jgi:hypothetical protein